MSALDVCVHVCVHMCVWRLNSVAIERDKLQNLSG